LVLRWLLWRPVSEFLEKRRQSVINDIEAAKEDRQRAEELVEQHKKLIEEGRREAASIIEAAGRQAEARREEILAQAQKEAEAIVQRATIEISQQRDKAVQELRQEVSALAVAVAEKMIARSLDIKDQQVLLKQAVEELGEGYAKYSS
jgi:F-type H+-transporting ATPase subunit b